MMVSGPNLNETSVVSGGYGGSGDGLIPTGMNDQNRTGNLSEDGERNGSGEHRICLRKLELSLEILETPASMNPMYGVLTPRPVPRVVQLLSFAISPEVQPFSLLPPPESR